MLAILDIIAFICFWYSAFTSAAGPVGGCPGFGVFEADLLDLVVPWFEVLFFIFSAAGCDGLRKI